MKNAREYTGGKLIPHAARRGNDVHNLLRGHRPFRGIHALFQRYMHGEGAQGRAAGGALRRRGAAHGRLHGCAQWCPHACYPHKRLYNNPRNVVYVPGLSLIATQGIPITKLPQAFRDFGCGDIFGMESGVTMALMAVIALIPIFYFMRWGSYVMSLGSNPEALKRSGVKIWKYRVSAFALMGLLSSVAGVIVTARLNSAEANAGLNMEMEAICAVIMGGTALHGGKGSLPGTVIAVILLGLIRNGLTVMSVSSYYQQFVTGALLLIAVVTAELRERRNRIG